MPNKMNDPAPTNSACDASTSQNNNMQHTSNIQHVITKLISQSSELTKHIFIINGVSDGLAQWHTDASRVAYVIEPCAVLLYKADMVLNLEKRSSGPSDLYFHMRQIEPNTYSFYMTFSDLGDFENLYYATVAKYKQLLHTTKILLAHGFKAKNDIYLQYPKGDDRLHNLDPITIGDFQRFVFDQETLLLNTMVQKVLVRGKGEKLDRLLLYMRKAHQHHIPFISASSKNLKKSCKMSSAMIYGELAEEYLYSFKSKTMTLEAAQKCQPTTTNTIAEIRPVRFPASPHNLAESASNLYVVDEPKLPCFCDFDCVCTSLCAKENYLAEKNSPSIHVTEGLDIDELNVSNLAQTTAENSGAKEESTRGSAVSSVFDVQYDAQNIDLDSQFASHRDILTQPFAKLCDTPPRKLERSSFGKLLFTVKSKKNRGCT